MKKKKSGSKALTTDGIRKFAEDLEKEGKNNISYPDMCKLWSYAVSTSNEQDNQENPNPVNPDEESKDKIIPVANQQKKNANQKSNFLAVKEASDEKSIDEDADGKEANGKEAKDMMDMSGGDESGEKVDPEIYAEMLEGDVGDGEGDFDDIGDADADVDDIGDPLQNGASSEEDEGGLLEQKSGGVKRKATDIAQPNPKKQLTNSKKAKPVETQ
jgi:hypothetical protein